MSYGNTMLKHLTTICINSVVKNYNLAKDNSLRSITCCVIFRYGFVEYENVEDAKSVFDKADDIELDGHTLFIDFATKRTNIGLGGGWEKEVDLNEGSKNCVT